MYRKYRRYLSSSRKSFLKKLSVEKRLSKFYHQTRRTVRKLVLGEVWSSAIHLRRIIESETRNHFGPNTAAIRHNTSNLLLLFPRLENAAKEKGFLSRTFIGRAYRKNMASYYKRLADLYSPYILTATEIKKNGAVIRTIPDEEKIHIFQHAGLHQDAALLIPKRPTTSTVPQQTAPAITRVVGTSHTAEKILAVAQQERKEFVNQD